MTDECAHQIDQLEALIGISTKSHIGTKLQTTVQVKIILHYSIHAMITLTQNFLIEQSLKQYSSQNSEVDCNTVPKLVALVSLLLKSDS